MAIAGSKQTASLKFLHPGLSSFREQKGHILRHPRLTQKPIKREFGLAQTLRYPHTKKPIVHLRETIVPPSEGGNTVKQYLGTTIYDRDPQGVTSAQPPAPLSQKGSSNQKPENPKKSSHANRYIPPEKVTNARR